MVVLLKSSWAEAHPTGDARSGQRIRRCQQQHEGGFESRDISLHLVVRQPRGTCLSWFFDGYPHRTHHSCKETFVIFRIKLVSLQLPRGVEQIESNIPINTGAQTSVKRILYEFELEVWIVLRRRFTWSQVGIHPFKELLHEGIDVSQIELVKAKSWYKLLSQ